MQGSPWNSPRQSAIAEGFVKVNITWLFPSKICVQFTIFNTYFSTKLSFTNISLESVYMCYKKPDQLYIFDSLFILFLFVHLAIEQPLLPRLISSYPQNSVTSVLNNFYFFSFFCHHLSVSWRQRKIRLVTLSKSCSYKFSF